MLLFIFLLFQLILAYKLTGFLIKKTSVFLVSIAIVGKDLNKEKEVFLPEGLGIVSGFVYFLFLLFSSYLPLDVFTQNKKLILSIGLSGFIGAILGFYDDVKTLRWRYKVFLPIASLIPFLLINKKSFPFSIKTIIACVFCTNSINILSGINGLETGQALIIGIALLFQTGMNNSNVALITNSLFITVTFALFKQNVYPAKIFVGDSFCFFSGTILSIVWTLKGSPFSSIFFMFLQFINFFLSLPQLIGIFTCPKHRLPSFDIQTGLLFPSKYNGKMNLTLLNILLLLHPQSEKTLLFIVLFIQIFSVFSIKITTP